MYHTIDIRMCLEDFIEVFLLPNVDMIEFWSLAADKLDTIDDFFG